MEDSDRCRGFPPELRDGIKRYAKAQGVNKSEVIEAWLWRGLAEANAETGP